MIAAISARTSTRLGEALYCKWGCRHTAAHAGGRAGRSGSANEGVVDAAVEEKGHAIAIAAPHQCPHLEWPAKGRNDLQAYDGAELQGRARGQLRPMGADVDDLAGVAMRHCFDYHGPRHPGSVMLASISRHRVSHEVDTRQLACRKAYRHERAQLARRFDTTARFDVSASE